MTAKLRDHPMYLGNTLRQLQMCGDCRVRSKYSDELAPMDGEGQVRER